MFKDSAIRVVVALAVFVLILSATETVLEALLFPEWIMRLVTLAALAIGGVVLVVYLYRRRVQAKERERPSSQRGA